jgi:hypothetical protein
MRYRLRILSSMLVVPNGELGLVVLVWLRVSMLVVLVLVLLVPMERLVCLSPLCASVVSESVVVAVDRNAAVGSWMPSAVVVP